MSDDNRGAVYKQRALREGIDHGEDPSITCKPTGKSQKHLAQLGNDPIDDESKAVYSSKVGPAKEVSVTPADHEEDTNKESPNDVVTTSSNHQVTDLDEGMSSNATTTNQVTIL